MKKFFYTFIFSAFLFNLTNAQITITDADLGNGDYTWTSDQEYQIDGLVYLEEGGTLTIEAGTVIKGIESPTTGDNASALIITRGAQIFANGTANAPIIFTAEADDVTDPSDLGPDDKGFWGGLIILGNAAITDEAPEQNIEGIDSGEPRARYGGDNDADNSGVLRYISIRHGGIALSEGNEINGLTLGAVGSETTIEFVEVFANLDDGIEWFGGTVGVKNAVVSYCGDDGMDWDTGWRGKGQFWFVMTDTNGDNGGEHDGAKPDDNNPESDPIIYNATYVGEGAATRAIRMRDGTSGTYANSIFSGYQTGVEVEDTGDDFDSESNFLNGDLVLKGNIWFNNGSNTPSDFVTPNSTEVIDLFNSSENTTDDPAFANITFAAGNNDLDPRPAVGGAAYQGVCPIPADDDFFQSTVFKGAFGGGLWTRGWTALDNNNHFPATTEIVITDADLLDGDYTWTSDNTYLLDGFVFLEEGGKLTIEAGTIIKAKEVTSSGDNASALVITRGAQICAIGTQAQPIIFTAEADDVTDPNDLGPDDKGFWGGIIILGRASITDEAPIQNIEGIPSDEERARYGDENGNFNDADNSGRMEFVSIRHGGAALSEGNEINGLTLGAVGSSTVLENIEVFANLDDGIEWFGGTVHVKGAVVSYCGDDAMDWDTGWRGGGQFWFVMVDNNGDNGGEHDGAKPDDNNPESDPIIYNATYIGSPEASRALRFRDGTSGNYSNSIFTRFGTGMEIESTENDFDSESNFLNGDLELNNNIWWDFAGDLVTSNGTGDLNAILTKLSESGNKNDEDPDFNNVPELSTGDLATNLDPRPSVDGVAYTTDLADTQSGSYYLQTDFKGAFCDDGMWVSGWTAISELGLVDNSIPYADFGCDATVGTEDIEISKLGYTLSQNAPNPATNMTQIGFELPKSTNVSLVIYDMSGKVVAAPVNNTNMAAGIHVIDVNVADLQGGLYYYSLTNNEVTISKRLIVQ